MAEDDKNAVLIDGLSPVTAKSEGTVVGFADVCQVPGPTGPVPIPFPNIARSRDLKNGSRTVSINGAPVALKDSYLGTSTGNEAATAGGGVVSGKTKGAASPVNYSFIVMLRTAMDEVGHGVVPGLSALVHSVREGRSWVIRIACSLRRTWTNWASRFQTMRRWQAHGALMRGMRRCHPKWLAIFGPRSGSSGSSTTARSDFRTRWMQSDGHGTTSAGGCSSKTKRSTGL